MRKVFWCCTTAVLLAAAGLYLAAGHGEPSSGSFVTRCLVNSAGLATAIQNLWTPDQQKEDLLVKTRPGEPTVPAEPTPCAPCTPDKETVEAVVSRVIHLPSDPNPAPASIVISAEESKPAQPTGQVETSEWQKVEEQQPVDQGVSPGVPGTGPAPCPDFMPYATDDEDQTQPVTMPRIPDDEEPVLGAQETQEQTDPDKAATPSSEPKDGSECKEDPNYYHHYSGCPSTNYCPYTGRCYPAVEPQQPPVKMTPGQDETTEPHVKPKKHTSKKPRFAPGGEDSPMHPEVDTMEYRPSDGGLNEYGPGPF